MNNEIIIWKCIECGSIQISNPRKHHCMDICKCGKTGLDLERYLARTINPWSYLEIKKINFNKLDFFSELLKCCFEQGFYITIDRKYITHKTSLKLQNIEKEELLKLI